MSVETRYARNGGACIAYQVTGQGSFDLVFVPGFISNLELHWDDPGYSLLLRRLSAFSRLIQFDKRGTGLSDRFSPDQLPDLETRMSDVRAVMDAAGSSRAALLGTSEGAPMSILFAVTYPERTRALVIYGGYAHFHSWVMSPAALEGFLEQTEARWGSGATLRNFAPGRLDDRQFSRWWARFERLSASPTAATALARMNAAIDIRGILPLVRVPTLVIHRQQDARVDPAAGRYLAAHIPGARLVEIPGRDHPVWTGDVDRVADLVEEFLTGVKPRPHINRMLAVLLSARIVAPQNMAARLGDRAWGDCAGRFHAAAQAVATRHGGHLLAWDGERLAARFDGPAKAARSAVALREAAGMLGIGVAQAIHAGEIETDGEAVGGFAVHIAERIADRAVADDILASALVGELAAGSGLLFVDRDPLAVEGMDSRLRLVALAPEQHLEPAARRRTQPRLGLLTAREREVLAHVAAGLSNAAIAAEFGLSGHTVKRHVANILLKLDLPTRAAAAALAARQDRPNEPRSP